MKRTELKRRVALAIKALKGAPLVYDYPVPKLVVERQPIQTIETRFEVARPEVDQVEKEIVDNFAKRKLMRDLADGLAKYGLVRVAREDTPLKIIYRAYVRAIPPIEED